MPAMMGKRQGIYCHLFLITADSLLDRFNFLRAAKESLAHARQQACIILDIDPIAIH